MKNIYELRQLFIELSFKIGKTLKNFKGNDYDNLLYIADRAQFLSDYIVREHVEEGKAKEMYSELVRHFLKIVL